jgi:hypothetical protein
MTSTEMQDSTSTEGQDVVAVREKLLGTEEPVTEKKPLSQSPGRPEDVKRWP